MALRVVSLPATTSSMKNDASSAWVSASPSMLVVMSAVVRSSVGRTTRRAAELLHQGRELLSGTDEGGQGVRPVRDVLGVAAARITLEQRRTASRSVSGIPIIRR